MLTGEKINEFNSEGFLVFDGLLSDGMLTYYTEVFDELVAQGCDLSEEVAHWSLEYDQDGNPVPGLLHKVQGVCLVDSRVLELASEPVILDRVAALTGPNIDVFGTKFFPKLPNGGTSTHWHQDNFYFRTDTTQILSCAIYIEPADRDNGCLSVVPGSHRSGIVAHEKNPAGHGSWAKVDDSRAVDVVCSAGTVVLFSANLLHGAKDNESNRSSYRTAWHYMPSALNPEKFPRGEYLDRYTVKDV
ncbi:MAG: phytanoyl-CoA dioxygenase family protein [Candidatus Latescibacterota bacterium]|nr:phytanoyl-CoA dioxygenase family protein [Candidatus Latescibacterota bacterium]